MSHFSETLQALMALHDPPLSQIDLSEKTGISQATISRLLGGREPTREQVGQLCTVISDERERRVELLIADLRDRARVAIVAGIDERHYTLAPLDDAPSSVAPGTLAADLELIAQECAEHEDIRATISDLAHMIVRHRAEMADAARGVVYPLQPDTASSGPLPAPPPPAFATSAKKETTTDPFGAAVQREGDRRNQSNRDTNSL